MATPTWETRELPILEAIAKAEDDGQLQHLTVEDIASTTRLPSQTTLDGFRALLDADMVGAVDVSTFGGYDYIGIRLREKGRRAVGQWPGGDALGDLIRLLEARAEATTDPEERGRIRRLIDGAVDVGRGTMSEILAAYIRQQTGLP